MAKLELLEIRVNFKGQNDFLCLLTVGYSERTHAFQQNEFLG